MVFPPEGIENGHEFLNLFRLVLQHLLSYDHMLDSSFRITKLIPQFYSCGILLHLFSLTEAVGLWGSLKQVGNPCNEILLEAV